MWEIVEKAEKNTVLPHSVEKREILSHQKNISSNQLFSNLFSKTVTFTKFLLKIRESKFFIFPQCVTVWKLREFSLTHFWQKFRESNSFAKEITK